MLKITEKWKAAGEEVISFGPFQFLLKERRLTKDGQPVKLGGRALDVLHVLVENQGEIVGQKELMARVWPGIFVEEVSLRVHVAALRKALDTGEAGPRYLTNAPGRGYCFTAETSRKPLQGPVSLAPLYNLPPALARMVGRDEDVREICEKIAAEKLVTIVGAGGIGKTTVALTAGHTLLGVFDGAICFVDLSRVADPNLLAGTIAAAFGLPVNSPSPIPELVAHLRTRRTLLMLDNCEHLIFAVATFAERLLSETSNLRILATSREALRVADETVHRLSSLESPPAGGRLTSAEIASFPSVKLFMERLRSNGVDVALDDRNAPLVGRICRKLDGIALAIELAAGRVGTLGLKETATLLDSQFALRWPGRRTAPPRHQTMSATLEWSYNLLSDNERKALRRVSVFVGGFSAEDAQAIVANLGLSEEEACEAITGLIVKSLATADATSGSTRYRLLETTRAYAAMKLRDAGEENPIYRKYAEYFRDLLLETEALRRDPTAEPKVRTADIDNIRGALRWAFGPNGDVLIAIDLAAYSAPVWLGKALFAECSDWMTRALAVLPGTNRDAGKQQLLIQMALTSSEVFTTGFTDSFREQWSKALDLATTLGDVRSQLYSAEVLWSIEDAVPLHADALRRALSCVELAKRSSDPGALALVDWMTGVSEFHLGRLEQACTHLLRSLDKDSETSRMRMLSETGYDRRIDAMIQMADILWLRGFPKQAGDWCERAINEAHGLGRALPLSAAMTTVGVIKYLSDPDLDAIERDVVELLEHARTHSAVAYEGFGLWILGLCQARRGELDAAKPLVSKGLELLAIAHYGVFNAFIRTRLCEAAIVAGRREYAFSIMSVIDIEDRNPEQWCKPEILRVKGLLARAAGDRRSAEAFFLESMRIAQQQGALSWELKTATDLGKLMDADARAEEGADLVEQTYKKFTEGFETADLISAREFIEGVRCRRAGRNVAKAASTRENTADRR